MTQLQAFVIWNGPLGSLDLYQEDLNAPLKGDAHCLHMNPFGLQE